MTFLYSQYLHRARPALTPFRQYLARSPHRQLVTLAIETSCDDTAVAVLEHDSSTPESNNSRSARTRLLFNERITSDLRAYRGIRPAIALEGHQRTLAGLVKTAIAHLPANQSRHSQKVPDFVSVTRGPGIFANLATGLCTAKGLAVAWDVPLVGVHHMQAHALTPRLVRALGMPMTREGVANAKLKANTGSETECKSPEFPFLTFLVSGGHSQLVLSASLTDHRILATTTDAAIGNVLDQTARVILPEDALAASPDVMYGRQLETFAFPKATTGEDQRERYSFYSPPRSRADEIAEVPTGYPWTIPLPMRTTRRLAFSFSAIHSTVHRIAEERAGQMNVVERRALARHTQRAAFQHLVSRLCLALEDQGFNGADLVRQARTLVVAGGVACNEFLMHVLRATLEARGLLLPVEPQDESTANTAATRRQRGETESGNEEGGQKAVVGIREIVAPPVALCTDNAAMIAWAGMEMYEAGWTTELDVVPVPKWPLDPSMPLPEKEGGGPGGLIQIGGWSRWK